MPRLVGVPLWDERDPVVSGAICLISPHALGPRWSLRSPLRCRPAVRTEVRHLLSSPPDQAPGPSPHPGFPEWRCHRVGGATCVAGGSPPASRPRRLPRPLLSRRSRMIAVQFSSNPRAGCGLAPSKREPAGRCGGAFSAGQAVVLKSAASVPDVAGLDNSPGQNPKEAERPRSIAVDGEAT